MIFASSINNTEIFQFQPLDIWFFLCLHRASASSPTTSSRPIWKCLKPFCTHTSCVEIFLIARARVELFSRRPICLGSANRSCSDWMSNQVTLECNHTTHIPGLTARHICTHKHHLSRHRCVTCDAPRLRVRKLLRRSRHFSSR